VDQRVTFLYIGRQRARHSLCTTLLVTALAVVEGTGFQPEITLGFQ
jgi:hypothetical protein